MKKLIGLILVVCFIFVFTAPAFAAVPTKCPDCLGNLTVTKKPTIFYYGSLISGMEHPYPQPGSGVYRCHPTYKCQEMWAKDKYVLFCAKPYPKGGYMGYMVDRFVYWEPCKYSYPTKPTAEGYTTKGFLSYSPY